MYIVWNLVSLGVSPGSKLCAACFNFAKYFETMRCGCGTFAFIFSIYLKPILYADDFFNRKIENVNNVKGLVICVPVI